MRPIENDKTTSSVTMTSGEVVTLPTIILAEADASLLRQYRDWLADRRVTRRFFCRVCTVPDHMTIGRTVPMEMDTFITDAQIMFSCNHRRLFYQGLTVPTRIRFAPDPKLEAGILLLTPTERVLNETEREMLRAVKTFKRQWDIGEVNQCQDCFETAMHGDGSLRGGIDDKTGRISLRCAHRRFTAPASIA